MTERLRNIPTIHTDTLRLPELTNGDLSSYALASRMLPQTTGALRTSGLSHELILGIGEHVNQLLIRKYEKEKDRAIRALEEKIWNEAELVKERAVAAAMEKMVEEHQKRLKKQLRSHERAVKEEIVKVTGIIQKQALERLQFDRTSSERLHKATVDKENSICAQQLQQAIAEARAYELSVAAEAARATKSAADAEYERIVSQIKAENDKGLRVLEADWAAKRQAAADIYSRAEMDLYNKVETLRSHVTSRKKAFSRLAELDREIDESRKMLSDVIERKKQVFELLQRSKKSFQKSIDDYPHFDLHQTDYLVPSLSGVSLDSFERRTCSDIEAIP